MIKIKNAEQLNVMYYRDMNANQVYAPKITMNEKLH
jgi:hypothetical protein